MKETTNNTTKTRKAKNPVVTEPVVTEPVVIEEPIVTEEPVVEEPTMEETVGEAEVPAAPEPTMLSTGKWAYGPTTTINCCDCGKERVIKIQDAFQVIRCAACQKKAQNKKRAAKKKEANRTASLERRLAEARALLAEHDAEKANEE